MKHLYSAIRKITVFAFLATLSIQATAQFGEIRGKIKDANNGSGIDFATVVAELSGITKASVNSDEDGSYNIKTLTPGVYTIKVFMSGYKQVVMPGVKVSEDQITFLKDIMLDKLGEDLKEIVVVRPKKDILPKDQNKTVIGGNEIKNQRNLSINRIAGNVPGVIARNGATPSFLGSRSNATAYYVDGVRVFGGVGLTPDAINEVSVITGGVPAMYGDFTGGAISITTKGPSSTYKGSIDYSNSLLFDKFGFHNFQGYLTGPLKTINKKQPGKERTLIGFTLAVNATYQKDPSPSYVQLYKVKDDKLAELEKNPIAPAPTGDGFVPSAAFITMEDMEPIKSKINAQATSLAYNTGITYQPVKDMNIVIGSNGVYSRGQNYSFTSSLFNYANPSQSISQTYRNFIRFSQTLKKSGDNKDKEKSTSLITDAYYTVRFDYTVNTGVTQSAEHKDDIFNYGYVGKFQTYQAPSFTYYGNVNDPNTPTRTFVDQNGKTVTLRNFFEQSGYRDTAYRFIRSEMNPIKANYTQQVYDQFPGTIPNNLALQFLGGLRNGDNPSSVYSMWTNVGSYPTGYNKSRNEQFTLFAMGEASLTSKTDKTKKHDLQFGLQYEQRIQRGYAVGASGLWSLMTLLANNAVLELDKSKPYMVYDANGVFQDTIKYNRLYNADVESKFSNNLRKYLIDKGEKDIYGNPISMNSWVDVNSYDPSTFKLEWFSADDLYNNGSAYIDVFGYDYTGKMIKGQPSIKDWNENPLRPIGAFAPIYTAAWIQDKFAFKDLIFRLGLRAERYDLNTKVLKDPYLLFPTKTAAEWTTQSEIPSTIGSDYAVYVDNYKNANPRIVGFRNGSTWYNKAGNVIADPTILAQQAGGRIQPWLNDPTVNLNKYTLDPNAFEDYTPKLLLLPRIWFSFPISDEAQFFANYDVLAQRPPEGVLATYDDYQFFEQRALDAGLNNPNLQAPRRTSYEVGYKQAISSNSSLSFIASYLETRDLIQIKRFYMAFPTSYTSFGNEDFSTVKGFRVEYNLVGQSNFNINANYTLQFADGTGSNANTSAGLIAVNKPSLKTLQPLDIDFRHVFKAVIDYRFVKDNDTKYDGPVMKFKGKDYDVLANAGANITINAFSGAPYTATANKNVSQVIGGAATRNPISGSLNGQRLPGQVFADLTLDKTFEYTYTNKNDRKKVLPINVYIASTNFLNTRNVLSVFSNTGLPDDDGFLSSPEGIRISSIEVNRQAYVDLYRLRANDPGRYAFPRQTRLGIRFIFN